MALAVASPSDKKGGSVVGCVVLLNACLLLPAVAAAGARSLLADTTLASALASLPLEIPSDIPDCDEGVVEYLVGSKVDTRIIPYSGPCVKYHRMAGYYLRKPETVSLHLKGLPKTGTTWIEMIITELLQRICDEHLYTYCRHEHRYEPGHNRQLHLTIPSQEKDDNSAAVIQFTIKYKHQPTYNWSCDHLDSLETFMEDCEQVKLHRLRNPVRPPESMEIHGAKGMEWKDCVYKGPYSRINECIPEYMHTAKYPWNGDIGMLPLLQSAMLEGYHVDLSTAKRKYVVILRDPRDSAISNAHYVAGRTSDPNEYIMNGGCKEYISAFALFHYWQVEVQGELYPTLPIYYRDAVDDPVAVIDKVLAFLGLRATRDVVEEVLQATSAESMRHMEVNDQLPGANRHSDAPKTRKAHYNTYMEELNSTATGLCNMAMRRVLSEPVLRKFDLID